MSGTIEKLAIAEDLVRRGKVSRRNFIQLALAAGVGLAAAESMFAKAARAEPKRGGSFRVGISQGATTDTLDPATYQNQFTATMGWGATGNGLTDIDQHGEVTSDLADSFESSDGAKTWSSDFAKA
jgi:peptide/nickel transport system substrate-binding protein